ncbi:inactive poly [ADP-ribose] polymerase RCD1 [Nicotiana tabacum]|uniref:inactive poly [ADP-ribose] polymerase RCD1 n=1 Tax=Nicotiana tabacum TaxID=4097 RepID=UPI00051C8CAE|nr:probable inactive poly [ADP-ribose] polymerase SRO3 [Nicotiana tomentosiformis]
MDLNCKVLKFMMMKTPADSIPPLKIAGDQNNVVSPVIDGNKVKIQVPVPRKIVGGEDDVVDKKKLKIEVPIPRELLFPSAETASCYDHAQLLVQNYGNFKKSGEPVRFMFYKDGSWVNFEKNVMEVMVSGFVSGKPMIDVEMEGLKCLFDFYRMLEIDLDTGKERSISWIDVNGKCFFPKVFIDSSENSDDKNHEIKASNVNENFSSENPKIEIEIRISDDNSDKEVNNSGEELKLGKRKRGSEENEVEEKGERSSSNAKERRVIAATELHSPRWPKARSLREEEKGYQMVKGLLLSGLRTVDPGVTVTSIHQCVRTGPLEKARLEVFQTNMEIIKRTRGGNLNVVYAWYGTSAKNVEIILRHGFGMPSVVHGSNAHGVGVYLSPLRQPQNSAIMSEVDEYGEKHIVLCRVILGKLEKVELGSQQRYPSSVDFDTGVDDLTNPKWYVVWSANMNTHILPECVVSYKYGRHMSGQANCASSMKWAPHASNAMGTLISKLSTLLPPPKVQELQSLYGSYREGKLGKEVFMRQLRSVVGDEMLRSTILEIRG